VSKIDFSRCPFFRFVVASIFLSVLHGFLQIRWFAIRYSTLGTRPPAAEAFMGAEVLLLALITATGFVHVCDRKEKRPAAPYVLGVMASLGAWIAISFVP
jgi:hypothetical protein